MGQQNSNEDYWVRNILGGVVADIGVEPDCDTLERQLCRDLFLESKYISFDNFALDALRLKCCGALEYGPEGEIDINSEYDELILRPIGKTSLGALCELVGQVNQFGEPECILTPGCFYTVNAQRLFRDSQFALSDELWPINTPSPVVESDISGQATLLFTGGLGTSAHMVFWQTYSPRELDQLRREGGYYKKTDFKPIIGSYEGELFKRYRPSYLQIAPSTIIEIEAQTKKGEKLVGTL